MTGAGIALDAVTRGLSSGDRRGAGLGQRHVEPVEQARARRPALPADARLPPGARGAHRARPADQPPRPAPGQARARSSTRWRTASGSAPTSAPASRCTTRSRSVAGRQARDAAAPAPDPQGHGAAVPRPAPRRRDRRRPLLGRQRRRRPPRRDARPHRRLLRRARRVPHPGGRAADHARGGAVTGAEVVDLETGEHIDVRAPARSSTRPACGPRRPSRSPAPRAGCACSPRKGIHIVVPREPDRAATSGLILQTEKSVLFVIPWSRYWVIGTTDTPWEQELAHPVATSADIDYVIEHANAVLSRPLTRDDIIGTWAGLRPLLQPGTKAGTSSAKVSREHTVASPTPGLTVIAGGKLTTYRVMAKDAVDFAHRRAAPRACRRSRDRPAAGRRRGARRCSSARPGAIGADATAGPRPRMDHLLHRYGSLLGELIDLVDADPTLGRAADARPGVHRRRGRLRREPRGRAAPRRRADAPHPAQLRAGATRASAPLEEIADLVAPVLGWDARHAQPARSRRTARGPRPRTPPRRSRTTPRPRRSGCAPPTSRRCSADAPRRRRHQAGLTRRAGGPSGPVRHLKTPRGPPPGRT